MDTAVPQSGAQGVLPTVSGAAALWQSACQYRPAPEQARALADGYGWPRSGAVTPGCAVAAAPSNPARLCHSAHGRAAGHGPYRAPGEWHQLEHIFSFGVALESPPEAIGPVAEGIRVNFYCQGGEVTGPKLQGRCRSVGGDWLTIRTDGVAILDVRTTLESHDGALIAITYSGVADIGNDGYQRFLEGNLPARLTLHVVPRCQTAHPGYLWLNRVQCLGIGEVDLERSYVSYDVYAVR